MTEKTLREKLKPILRETIRKYNLKNPSVSIKAELEDMRNILFDNEL